MTRHEVSTAEPMPEEPYVSRQIDTSGGRREVVEVLESRYKRRCRTSLGSPKFPLDFPIFPNSSVISALIARSFMSLFPFNSPSISFHFPPIPLPLFPTQPNHMARMPCPGVPPYIIAAISALTAAQLVFPHIIGNRRGKASIHAMRPPPPETTHAADLWYFPLAAAHLYDMYVRLPRATRLSFTPSRPNEFSAP